jgi:hypothetical protein
LDFLQTERRKTAGAFLVVLVVCVFLTVSFLLPTVFTIARAFHEHDNDGAYGSCSECSQIAAAQNLQKQYDFAFIREIALFFVIYATLIFGLIRSWIHFPTLTALKIQINS